jgi:hypothetical protein
VSWLHHPSIALATLLWLVGVAPAQAQTVDADHARVRFGPVALAPVVRVTNAGGDSNVFNVNEIDHPTSDFTADVSPAVDAWIRMRRLRLNGHSQLEYVYFRELSELRSLNTENSAHLELLLNRLTPYVNATLVNTRSRPGFEVDAFARRRDDSARVGADVRLTGKASAGLYGGRSRVVYEGGTLYLGTDLAHAFNHTETIGGAAFRYAATPLTTVAVSLEQQRDRFAFSSDRNSDSFRVMPAVEFKPLALISGRAAVGFRRFSFVQGDVPDIEGVVADVDLTYTLRGRTQFTVAARRDLEYSYRDLQNVYVIAGFTVSATQRIGDGWELRGTVGRFHLDYRNTFQAGAGLAGETAGPGESDLSLGMGIGYHIGRSRVGFNVDRYQRSSLAVGRDYERLVVGSSLTYIF